MNIPFYIVLFFYVVFVVLVGWSAFRTSNSGWRSGLLLTFMMGSIPIWVVAMIWAYCFLTGQQTGFGIAK